MHGWIIGENIELNIEEGWKSERRNQYMFAENLLNKFPEDIINSIGEESDFFLDGYVVNKKELLKETDSNKWSDAFEKIYKSPQFVSKLRGAFGGFILEHKTRELIVYTDHMGNHAVYYYNQNGKRIIGSNLYILVQTLKKNRIQYHLDNNAAKYMLTYGYMLDDSTFIKEIKRVLPGYKVILKNEKIVKEAYYCLNNKNIEECSIQEAIDKVDKAFRIAVQREFEKDREYGYRHLVDLSGGLDSRMVSWVADEMGYRDQLNITYCKNGYLDQKISQRIAEDLKHDFLFKPLDDMNWLYDIDENVKKNNGAALFDGITGGNRFLKLLDKNQFGIEHTGMIGDVVLSAFFAEEDVAYAKPKFGKLKYSDRLTIQLNKNILENYPNQEIFTLVTRGILGAASSYIIRQNYFETASPFMDVDFMDTCLRLPLSYRARHKIYLEWIWQKYPEAAEYGWEKWGGVKPKKTEIPRRKVITAWRLLKWRAEGILGKSPKDINMNPVDYWYGQNPTLQSFFETYFYENIENPVIENEIKKAIEELFHQGNVWEKGMALTVLGLVKLYFDVI